MREQAGKFITLEGGEGMGKSTVRKYVQSLLEEKNISYVLTREPGGTPMAEAIRQVLLQSYEEIVQPYTELFLMFASRAQHIEGVIKPALAQGQWVISDRFTDASFAYQGGGRGIPQDHIQALSEWTGADIQPDLTLLLDASAEVGQSRMRRRTKARIEQEDLAFFERVRKMYLRLATLQPHRYRVIQADQSLTHVKKAVASVMEEVLS